MIMSMATDSGQLRIGEPDSRLARLDRHRPHVSPRQGLRKAQANLQ